MDRSVTPKMLYGPKRPVHKLSCDLKCYALFVIVSSAGQYFSMWPEVLCTICYIIPKIHWFLCVYMKFEKVNIGNNSVWKYHGRLKLLHTSVCCWVFFFSFFDRWICFDFWGGLYCFHFLSLTLYCFFFFFSPRFLFGGWSLWVCLCCNCVHVIRIDKSDIWTKVKVEYPWISDNVICRINKARLNMLIIINIWV